ncbi:MAG: AbiV family abortive infection protein [Dehalococcoidales bacterium]|nr:AbiV family abortive infection protein [Dehalococcoidales bacterium]
MSIDDVTKGTPQYKGKLNFKQIANGINAANRNAISLIEDAELLLKNKRYASAAALAILSIEESGKKSLLRGMSVLTKNKDIIDHWRDYRKHTKKNMMWLLPHFIAMGKWKFDDLKHLFSTGKHAYMIEQLKQFCLYTDCIGEIRWSEPSKFMNEELAEITLETAKLLKSDEEETVEDLRIWAKHFKKGMDMDMDDVRKASLHYFAELKERGKYKDGMDVNQLMNWLNLGQIEDKMDN